ncbi:UNVERIFIED_CONTAM: TusA-related sulfurtransferase [Acetivibrio alkalicellulosi]
MSEIKSDAYIDITDVVCPMTFVKTKVAIEDIENGQVLEVKMNEGEPVLNVPRSLKEEGHKVISVENNGDRTFTVWVKKGDI